MKRTEFRLLPVPAELFDELGFTEDMTLEAFVEERRLVLQKADEEDTFCGAYFRPVLKPSVKRHIRRKPPQQRRAAR